MADRAQNHAAGAQDGAAGRLDQVRWAADWLDHLAAVLDRSQHTVDAYRRDLVGVGEHLAEQVGTPAHLIEVEQLTSGVLAAAMRRWSLAGPDGRRSAASRRRAWSAWSSLCSWLVRQGALEGNPMEAVDKPAAPKALPRRIEGQQPLRRLLAAAGRRVDDGRETRWPARDRALVACCAFLGLRVSELVALDRGSLGSDGDGQIQLRVVGKGNKQRVVPVPHPVHEVVRAYLADRIVRHGSLVEIDHHSHDDDQALFVHVDTGRRMTRSQVEHLFDRLYRMAGIAHQVPPGTRVHALRHQAAFSWLSGGAQVSEVKDLLGHESLDTTYRYVVADGAGLRDAVQSHSELDVLEDGHPGAAPDDDDRGTR